MNTRRTPRLLPFLLTGAILGFAVGGFLGLRGVPAGGYSATSAMGYLGLLGALFGTLLGAIAYLIADR